MDTFTFGGARGPVTRGPSGDYGFVVTDPLSYERHANMPIIMVVQRVGSDFAGRQPLITWGATPARYYADTIAENMTGDVLSIDYGIGWKLSVADTKAFKAFAQGVLSAARGTWVPPATVSNPDLWV